MNGYLLTRQEARTGFMVGVIMAMHFMGTFLILPIFSVYAMRYPGATLTNVGLAFGINALTEGLLQIPFGWASDRYGRKPLLLIGLVTFTLGNLACALAEDIYQLSLARALQGAGVVSSVAMAALGDLTRPQVRTQAFTISGIMIGTAFVLGFLAGPLLAELIGLRGLFYLLGFVGVAALATTVVGFPRINTAQVHGSRKRLKEFLQNKELRRLCLAIFILSFAINLFLFTYPLDLAVAGSPASQLWKIYLIAFLPSLVLVFPYVRYAERKGEPWKPTRAGWCFMAGSFVIGLVGGSGRLLLYATGAAFVLGYSLCQPLLPSILTQLIPPGKRGAAIGLYNVFAAMGAALGGMLAGLSDQFHPSLPSAVGFVILLVWLFLGLPKQPGGAM